MKSPGDVLASDKAWHTYPDNEVSVSLSFCGKDDPKSSGLAFHHLKQPGQLESSFPTRVQPKSWASSHWPNWSLLWLRHGTDWLALDHGPIPDWGVWGGVLSFTYTTQPYRGQGGLSWESLAITQKKGCGARKSNICCLLPAAFPCSRLSNQKGRPSLSSHLTF